MKRYTSKRQAMEEFERGSVAPLIVGLFLVLAFTIAIAWLSAHL